MPNHCSNDLYVRGSSKEIQSFKEFAYEKKMDEEIILSHEKFVPSPHRRIAEEQMIIDKEKDVHKKNALKILFELEHTESEKKGEGWYDWALINWGTKWGIYDSIIVKESKTSIKYNFNTAWSPCFPVIVAMSQKFPKLIFTLKYYESGCGFKGVLQIKNGVNLKDEYTSDYRGGRGG